MDQTSADAPTPPRRPADAPPWRATWTRWPGSLEPLLLLASPGRPYHGPRIFTPDQADSWYCTDCLRMAPFAGEQVVIPPLPAVTVHVGTTLQVRVVDRPWLEPDLDGSDDAAWAAAHLGRTIIGAMFTGPHPLPPRFHEFFLQLYGGAALVGSAPVITDDEHGRPR